MRILHGSKVTEASSDQIDLVRADGRERIIDLGAGDGRYVYQSARADPSSLYIAVDPDAETLAEYAYRASRKPARGGVDNAMFVVASVESLPSELQGVASRVRVNFPWGSLLRGLLEADRQHIVAMLGLTKDDGLVEIVMSYDPSHDTGAFGGPPLPVLDASHLESKLLPAYEAAGADVYEHRRMTQDEALTIPSTWGRRLLHARPREVFWLAMRRRASR